MKKRYRIVAVLASLLLFSSVSFSRSVSKQEVETISQNYLNRIGQHQSTALSKRTPHTIKSIEELSNPATGGLLAYVVNIEPRGFMILSPATEFEPLIAYSIRHDWIAEPSVNNPLYQFLLKDLELRQKMVSEYPWEIIQKNQQKWRRLLNEQDAIASSTLQWPPAGTTPTGGWIETTWELGSPLNKYCPIDQGTGQRSQVGCVALAMAQVLNYHKHVGDLVFDINDRYRTKSEKINIDRDHSDNDFPDFDQLNSYLDEVRTKFDNSEPLDENDIAALCFACGILLEMDYRSAASGAELINMKAKLHTRLGMTTAEFQYYDESNDSFVFNLITNIINARPVPITIKGHAIIVDGYNATDGKFHVNWGAGDNYPNPIIDCWYSLPFGLPLGKELIDGIFNIDPQNRESQLNIVVGDTLENFYLHGAEVGEASRSGTVEIKNRGSEPIRFLSVAVSSPFEVSEDNVNFSAEIFPNSLSPGEKRYLYVRSIPDTLGRIDGKLKIFTASNEETGYHVKNLIAHGIPKAGTTIINEFVSAVWSKTNSPYYLCRDIRIEGNSSLRIMQGTRVIALGDYGITIDEGAEFFVLGSAKDSVYFSALNEDVGWSGFEFDHKYAERGYAFQYCVFKDCKKQSNGGAITMKNGRITIKHCSFSNNRALNGGAISLDNSEGLVSFCTFSQNTASNFGGAIHLVDSTPLDYDNELIPPKPLIQNTILCDNHATNGGAIFVAGQSVPKLTNVTVTKNHAESGRGGGIFIADGCIAEIKNSIFWGNYARTGTTLSFDDEIFPDEWPFKYCDIDTGAVNWIYHFDRHFKTRLRFSDYNNISMRPLFNKPDSNDFTLNHGSPCIDAGDPSDDRWQDEPSPHGFCINMGAYGGTSRAAITEYPTLTVSPNPIDYGQVYNEEPKELKCYLKNGSNHPINIEGIEIEDKEHISLIHEDSTFTFYLEANQIDSFSVQFKPSLDFEGIYQSSIELTVPKLGAGRKIIKARANFPQESIVFIAPDTSWTRSYGTSDYDIFQGSVFENEDGSFHFMGNTRNIEGWKIWLTVTDSLGHLNRENQRYLVGNGEAKGMNWQRTSDGGYILIGSTAFENSNNFDVYLLKLDRFFNMMWDTSFGGPNEDYGLDIIETSDGGYFICGSKSSFGAGGYDLWLLKTDSLGDTLWSKVYGGAANETWLPPDLDYKIFTASAVQAQDDGYYVITYTNSYGHGGSDVWLLRTDSNGDTLWTETYGDGGDEYSLNLEIRPTPDGGFVFNGGRQDPEVGRGLGAYLQKINSEGDSLWCTYYGGYEDEVGTGFELTDDGKAIYCGYVRQSGTRNVFISKIDSSGKQLWIKEVEGENLEIPLNILQTSEGEYLASGFTYLSVYWKYQGYAMKFAKDRKEIIEVRKKEDSVLAEKAFGGESYDVFWDVKPTSDNGFIFCGDTWSFGNGHLDMYIVKTDQDLNEEWQQYIGGPSEDWGGEICEVRDGCYVAIGKYTSRGDADVYLVYLNAYGDTLWTKTYGLPNQYEVGCNITQTADGGYLIGATKELNGKGLDIWLIKTDGYGNMEWEKTLGGPYDDVRGGFQFFSLKITEDGGYVIASTQHHPVTDLDAYLLKTDAAGDTMWFQPFRGEYQERLDYGLELTSDGGYVITGSTNSYGVDTPRNSNIFLIKYDKDGNEQWPKPIIIDDYGSQIASSVRQLVNGGYIIAGWASAGLFDDVYILLTDNAGNREYTRKIGGLERDYAYAMQATNDGCYILAGNTRSFGAGHQDGYAIKYKPAITPVSVPEFSNQPSGYGLSQNYPNPFNPTTTIEYTLPKACKIKLEIFNILGRKVCNLIDCKQPAGHHTIKWDGTNRQGFPVAAGIYFCRMKAGDPSTSSPNKTGQAGQSYTKVIKLALVR